MLSSRIDYTSKSLFFNIAVKVRCLLWDFWEQLPKMVSVCVWEIYIWWDIRDTYDETYMETTAEKNCIFNTFVSPGWTRGPKMQRGLPKVWSVYLWLRCQFSHFLSFWWCWQHFKESTSDIFIVVRPCVQIMVKVTILWSCLVAGAHSFCHIFFI